MVPKGPDLGWRTMAPVLDDHYGLGNVSNPFQAISDGHRVTTDLANDDQKVLIDPKQDL